MFREPAEIGGIYRDTILDFKFWSVTFVMWKNETLNIWNFWRKQKIHNVIVSRWKHILIITVFRWP